eukprot:CAMPEP_0182571276 /NCGR_PEP_ID=MMETSP1324-20130603/12910_1 /TAXON_ID=236786 /ORGANISM="Florenciella sp., Strain RCC1587" /LENGTH=338 /DNA_ID=CAMNT_0024785831 /DNA_START=117 /DNA_END=1134 /DNA_ORIENTATION=+
MAKVNARQAALVTERLFPVGFKRPVKVPSGSGQAPINTNANGKPTLGFGLGSRGLFSTFSTIAARTPKGVHSLKRQGIGGLVMGGVGLGMLVANQSTPAALCAEGDEEKAEELPEGVAAAAAGAAGGGAADGEEADDAVSMALRKLSPIASKLGFGGFLGMTAGYALKKIGKMAAFGTGCLFILFQGAAYAGFIDIHWNAIEHKMEESLDLDGDGKLTMSDAVVFWKKYLKPMLTTTYHRARASPLASSLASKTVNHWASKGRLIVGPRKRAAARSTAAISTTMSTIISTTISTIISTIISANSVDEGRCENRGEVVRWSMSLWPYGPAKPSCDQCGC